MRCIEYNENYKEKWIDFVEKNPQSTLYHDILWKNVLGESFSLKSHYLICISESNEIIGILPLFEIKDIFRRAYLISIPYFTNAGICISNENAKHKLIEKTIKIAQNLNVQYVELRHLTKYSLEGLKNRFSFATSILNIDIDKHSMWKKMFSDSVRRNICKAQNSNLEVSRGKEELLNFFKVYTTNMHDLGSPAMPLRFLENILSIFSKRSTIIVIKQNNTAIAGMIVLKHKKTLYDPFVSSLKKYNYLRQNNLLYWEAIKFGQECGLTEFDLGRSTIGSGVFNFKSRWGAKTENLSYQYIFNRIKRMPICDSVNNKYALCIKIWKKLPLWVTNYIGPKLIPYLPEL